MKNHKDIEQLLKYFTPTELYKMINGSHDLIKPEPSKDSVIKSRTKQ